MKKISIMLVASILAFGTTSCKRKVDLDKGIEETTVRITMPNGKPFIGTPIKSEEPVAIVFRGDVEIMIMTAEVQEQVQKVMNGEDK